MPRHSPPTAPRGSLKEQKVFYLTRMKLEAAVQKTSQSLFMLYDAFLTELLICKSERNPNAKSKNARFNRFKAEFEATFVRKISICGEKIQKLINLYLIHDHNVDLKGNSVGKTAEFDISPTLKH